MDVFDSQGVAGLDDCSATSMENGQIIVIAVAGDMSDDRARPPSRAIQVDKMSYFETRHEKAKMAKISSRTVE
jgi:hypothetical protein